MKPFYSKYKFNCNDLIKDYCVKYLENNWDFTKEKIFRLNTNEKELV